MSWGSFPQAFVDTGALKRLGTSAGKHRLGALKVYFALCMRVDFKTRSVSIGIRQLKSLTGMSKPIILRSIKELEDANILQVDRGKFRSSKYTLLDRVADKVQFAKVPNQLFDKVLRALPNKGAAGVAALAIYLVLLARRERNSNKSRAVSHERLIEQCAIRPEHVRSGIDVLINHRLVHVTQAEKPEKAGHPINDYELRGVFSAPKPNPNPRTIFL